MLLPKSSMDMEVITEYHTMRISTDSVIIMDMVMLMIMEMNSIMDMALDIIVFSMAILQDMMDMFMSTQ